MWNRLLATILLYLQLTFAYNYKYGAEIFGKEKTSLNAPGYPHGCSPSLRDQLKPGLSMEIYSYALVGSGNHCWDSAYLDPEFPRSGYLKHKLLGKAEGVLGPLNFLAKNPQCKPAVSTLPPGFNYPDPITITNFTMILYGYFAPKKSGKYTFKLAADDLLLMNFGADNAFDCCSHEQTKNNIGEYIAYSVWPSTNMSVTVYLESSIYYPLRLFFNNRDAIAQFDFSYYLDDSPVRETDFSEMFFSIPDGVKCPAHIGYKFECRSIKSTTTYSTQYITTKSAKNEIALTSTIYYVATPCADKPTPPLCGEGFYDPVNKKCFTPEPDYTTTINKGNGEYETDLISHIVLKDHNGTPTKTIRTTIKLTPTEDYTTTVTSDGHTITEVVSHITTTDSAGEGVVYVTTRMFYAEVGDAVHTSARPYSQPSVVTRTVSESDGVVDTVVISYFPSVGEDGVTRTVTSTVSTITADYTTTVTSDGHTITEVVSHITTTDSAGEGVVYVTTRMFYAEVGDAVHTSARPYSQPSVVTRTVSESDGVVDTVVISYFPSVGEDGVTRTVTSTVSTITADYTTTVTSDGHTITEVVSHITTTDSAGEGVVYVTTRMFYAEVGDAVHTSARPYSQPSVVTRTVSESDGVVDTVVISYFPSVGEDGVTRTVTSTVSTITADYTTTVTSDGHTITEVVSHITTTDSAGEGVVYVTTRMFYAEVGDAVHTSARPYSQPSVVTRTVSESDGVVDTVVISYFPSVGEDGVTRTVTSTVSTITADYTTTVTSDGHTITEVVSHITTTDSAGEGVVYVTTRMFYAEVGDAVHTSARPYSQPSVVTRTVSESDGVVDTVVISYFPSVGEDGVTRTVTSTVSTITADYTTTVTSDGHTITEFVSHVSVLNSLGEIAFLPKTFLLSHKLAPLFRTRYRNSSSVMLPSLGIDSSSLVCSDISSSINIMIPLKPSDAGEADYTTTIDKGNGEFETDLVSHITTKDSDGKPTTITTTIPLKPSDAGEADYTTTIDKGNGEFETDLVSHITTKDSDGKPTTITTTIPLKPSDAGEADYTTTIDKGNGEFETDLVSHITTKDSDGKPTTITTTIPLKPSDAGEADYTTTIDKGNGEFETDLVSHITTKDSDGKPTTITTTIPLKPSDAGEADYTTTIDKGNGEFETDLVSHITTKDSDGKPTTITTTIPLKPSDAGEADYTTTIISDGHTITEVVSHVTTTDSDGKTITYITTMASYDQVDEGVFTSPAPYSQPPVVTSTVTEDDGSSKTVVISYFPSEGEDGVTRTGINTVSTILLDGGQASHSSQAIFDGYQSLATRSSLRNSTKLSDVPSKSAIINTPHGSTHLTAESAPTGGITNQSESLLSPSVASSIKSDRNNSVSDNSISISSKVSRIAMSGTKNGGSNSIGYPVGTTFLPSKSTLMPSISVNIAEGGADAIQFSLSLGSLSIVVVTMLMVITTV
ncbi:EPA13 [Nakaseomyces glabratus]|nr:EPA13 [Nakaseomyces glabratus]UCS28572.1 EPA13 [Nakaseomyces glabratus]UCS33801.1 EPA13 [Nakaseomyces glabratus]UCS39031.1 EPA13 [Nakaseomyces glabratus]